MEEAHDDRYLVFVRTRRDHDDPPEDGERPVISCASYEEACKVREAHRRRARDCVIRYVGPAGGGD